MNDCDAHELEVLRWEGETLVLQCTKCGYFARVEGGDLSWEAPKREPEEKIYRVRVEGEMYVLAGDDEEAANTADESLRSSSPDESGLEIKDPEEVHPDDPISREWLTSIPFASDKHDLKDRSVAEFLGIDTRKR